jgi:hypothetical protein
MKLHGRSIHSLAIRWCPLSESWELLNEAGLISAFSDFLLVRIRRLTPEA